MKRLLALGLLLAQAASALAQPGKPAIQLKDAPLEHAIWIYTSVSGRTALISPALPNKKISLEVPVTLATNTPHLMAEALAAQDILIINDGRIFYMIVPKSWEKIVQPQAAQIRSLPTSATNHLIKAGEISLTGAPLRQTLELYAALAKAKIDPDSPSLPEGRITFASTHPLTREEAMYALRTLLLWNGVKVSFPKPDIVRAEPVGSK